MIIAVIPARAGSQRLPGKNLAELDGRPLLAYSVLLAQQMKAVDRVVVVSDGAGILTAASRWGAERCLLPQFLADGAHMLETIQYAVEWSRANADWVLLLQPTSPLRRVEQTRGWIEHTLERAAADEVDGSLTVDRMPLKLGAVDAQGIFVPQYTPGIEKQLMVATARENGLFYLLSGPGLRQGRLFGSRMLALNCAREQSLANIDYAWDLEFTRWAYRHFDYGREFPDSEGGG